MGFVHFWEVYDWNSEEWQVAWRQLIEDAQLIMLAADVPLCGEEGGRGQLSPVNPPIVDLEEGIYLNGLWKDGHESFVFSESNDHAWCKVGGGTTTQKPYGIVVACILLRAFVLAPDQIAVGSDGRWTSRAWTDTRKLYHSIWPDQALSCPWAAPGRSHDDTRHTVYPPSASNGGAINCMKSQSGSMSHQDALSLSHYSKKDAPCTVSDQDFSTVQDWLSQCDLDHPACNAWQLDVNNLPGVSFRVVDVQHRCVVVHDHRVGFVALSYVWGGVEQLKLDSTTTALLMSEGGLNDLWAMLSTTVRDAILVCEKLGERYLWTDSLCIMQDSVRDMKVQISWMRQVYSAAKFTITAVSSETAEIGLLGCRTGDSNILTTEDELAELVETAPWSDRAWCYQESALSHRLLLFTSRGVFMQCQESSYDIDRVELEGNRYGDTDKFNSCGSMLPPRRVEDPLESYLHAVQHFSQRKLSKPGDKLNAFTGIIQRYQQIDDDEGFSLHYGLPVAAFDQIFCWRLKTYNSSYRNSSFPSWSWLGWIGPAAFDLEVLQKVRTNQMLYHNNEHMTYSDVDWRAALELRKPANSGFLPPEDIDNARFGFPATQSTNTSESSSLWLDASFADLRIATDPSCSEGTQGLYAVYPVHCSQEPPEPPPKTITLRDTLVRPKPKLKFMDEETAAAPSIPMLYAPSGDPELDQHSQHANCEAQSPIGYIWLHKEWRAQQPETCTMEFIALTGDKDEATPNQWRIKMLMLLQRMEKNRHFWAHERVQVMDCDIEQQLWLRIRAHTSGCKLV